MAKERLKRLASSSNVPGFLASALPALILFIGFQTAGVFPFGDRHILTIDLFHQYAPFLAEYRRKLLSFGTLQFSWNGGLGIDFYSLFAYYLSSPLNLLIVLFPESQLSNFVLFSVVLKTGLAGYTGYFYLRRGRAHTPWVSVVFAMGYALSSFTLAISEHHVAGRYRPVQSWPTLHCSFAKTDRALRNHVGRDAFR